MADDVEFQDGDRISKGLSVQELLVASEKQKKHKNFCGHLRRFKRRKRRKKLNKMERSASLEECSSNRISKTHLKHEHKCRKSKHTRENAYECSVAPGMKTPEFFSQREVLSPFEMNIAAAYRHLKTENGKLKNEIESLLTQNKEMKTRSSGIEQENANLKEDLLMLKNLVYKLNLELEKYQSGKRTTVDTDLEKLPKNYEKSFLKPVMPLLKAYAETIREKDEMIANLESEFKRFSISFNELLDENEKLYLELEKKISTSDGGLFEGMKVLKKDLELAQQENNLLSQQIKLEKEKLAKVHSLFKIKVDESSRDKEELSINLEECKSDLYLLKGKYAVLKQEFESLKVERDARVPMAVHSAAINECRQLFQDLKSEYENEKSKMLSKIKEQDMMVTKLNRQVEEWRGEKNFLEKSNFNQTFEIETLKKKISELENQLEDAGKTLINDKDRKEFLEVRKQLRESSKREEVLNIKLTATKKKLQKTLMFAEDIVLGQERLLLQLHAKQKENNYMTTQFGNLKNQLKDVERGAQKDLNSIEEKIKSLETENYTLGVYNRKLEKVLAEKEEIIRRLEPTKDL